MKSILSFSAMLILVVVGSCKKEKNIVLSDKIIAGQKTGTGIFYQDFNPDLHCYIINPWEDQDTSISLDLNQDGKMDFVFYRTMCHPGFLGGDCDRVTLVPLNGNGICMVPTEYPDPVIEPCAHSSLDWVDTLALTEKITYDNLWTNNESLIYKFDWQMNTCLLREGFWHFVGTMNQNFIGIKIVNDNKTYFGWIGIYCDQSAVLGDFIITDYALLEEYEE